MFFCCEGRDAEGKFGSMAINDFGGVLIPSVSGSGGLSASPHSPTAGDRISGESSRKTLTQKLIVFHNRKNFGKFTEKPVKINRVNYVNIRRTNLNASVRLIWGKLVQDKRVNFSWVQLHHYNQGFYFRVQT